MSELNTAALLEMLPWTGGTVIVLIAVTAGVGIGTRRHSVVDTAWGLLFAGIGVTGFVLSTGHGDPARRVLMLVMTVVWGVRLAVHIARRSRGAGEDPRYQALLAKGLTNPAANAIAKVYLPQAVIAFLISAPVQVGMLTSGGPGLLAWLGVLLWGTGMFFETVGDAQLDRYKAWKRRQPADTVRGSVMDRGLWGYTRHPNYFGDACVWWGLFLVAAANWAGVLTVLAPLAMTLLLTQGSGKRNLERSMATRPGYPEYMRRTSGFVPWPPKSDPPGPMARRPARADISLLRSHSDRSSGTLGR